MALGRSGQTDSPSRINFNFTEEQFAHGLLSATKTLGEQCLLATTEIDGGFDMNVQLFRFDHARSK